MTGNDIVKDTEYKIKDILKRYHEILNSIDILQEQIELLEELLRSDDLTSLIEHKEGNGKYNNDSVVEKEVFFNEQIGMAIEQKRKEIKVDIMRIKTAVNIKKSVIRQIDRILTSKELSRDEKFLLQYCYIDKKSNNDNYNDIVNRFNQGKNYIYSEQRIYQIRDKALKTLSLKFVKINYLLKDV